MQSHLKWNLGYIVSGGYFKYEHNEHQIIMITATRFYHSLPKNLPDIAILLTS